MTPIEPEEVTPSDGERTRNPGEWAQLTTGEHRLVQAVAKRERRIQWWKAIGLAGGAIAIVQFLNTAGPCSATWKFQTTEAAAVDKTINTADHTAIRQETATAIGSVRDAVDAGNRAVIEAVVDLKTKKGK